MDTVRRLCDAIATEENGLDTMQMGVAGVAIEREVSMRHIAMIRRLCDAITRIDTAWQITRDIQAAIEDAHRLAIEARESIP